MAVLIAAILSVALLIPTHAAAPRTAHSARGTLVFYSAQGYDSAMARAFQKVSGTRVLLTDDSTGNILAKIEAERNNPHWDVVWFDGDATMQGLDDEGQLLKWTPANIKTYTPLGRSLFSADHAFFPTGVTAAGVIIYNTRKLSAARVPKDWSDLLKPQFKNQVAENDPAYSGPAFPLIAGMMLRLGGLAKGEA